MVTNVYSSASISLVIPSFNRGDLISETIDCALAQTIAFHEVIVVDDGSSDNTADVLRAYGDRIMVVQLTNGGVQRARNIGVDHATGAYITLCDSDDLLEPTYVETATRCLRMLPATDGFYCNFATFSQDGDHLDKFSGAPRGFFDGASMNAEFVTDIPDLYARTIAYQPLFMSGFLIRKEFYRSIGGFDSAFNNVGAEDWEFTLRVIAEGKVVLCPTVLARVRKHSGNESANTIRQVLGTAKILEHALAEHPIATNYRSTILAGIDYRRRLVFQEAFAQGRFDLAEEMLDLLGRKSSNRKFQLKMLIMKLPASLRHQAWRLTQQ